MSVENCINAHITGRTSKEYYQHNRERVIQSVKDYYQDNKTHRNEYNRTYYERNKERIYEMSSRIIECPICKSTYTHNHKARHEKTLKHRSALSQASSSELSAMENLTSD